MTKPTPASEGIDALDGFDPDVNHCDRDPADKGNARNRYRFSGTGRPTRLARLMGQARRRSKASVTLAPVKLDGAQ